jgi:hypothetical protein
MSAPDPLPTTELRSLRLFSRLRGGAEVEPAAFTAAAARRPGPAIQDWLDPDDDRHLAAYERFQETGVWPAGFLPEGVSFPPAWDAQVAARLAERWLRHRAALRLRAEGVE